MPASRRNPEPKAEKAIFESPFKDLEKMLRDRSPSDGVARREAKPAGAPSTLSSAPVAPETRAVPDDEAMFRAAVDGVRRLGDQRPTRIAPHLEVSR